MMRILQVIHSMDLFRVNPLQQQFMSDMTKNKVDNQ